MTYSIKTGDTLPNITLTLSDLSGPIDLTYRTATVYISGRPGSPPILEKEATVIEPLSGTCSVSWDTSETISPGTYRLEVRVTDDNGDIITVPSDGYGLITINQSLGVTA